MMLTDGSWLQFVLFKREFQGLELELWRDELSLTIFPHVLVRFMIKMTQKLGGIQGLNLFLNDLFR